MIYWSQFNWQSFATLVAGLAAACGAVWIGLRQTRILDQQRLLAETNLRIQLLEKRSVCIEQMRDVVAEWYRDARLSPESMTKFQRAYQQAELLFSKATLAEMETALSGLFWTEHWQRRSRYYYERGKDLEATDKLEKSFEEDDKVFKIMPKLLEILTDESRVSDWIEMASLR
jgi:hypothetical protein